MCGEIERKSENFKISQLKMTEMKILFTVHAGRQSQAFGMSVFKVQKRARYLYRYWRYLYGYLDLQKTGKEGTECHTSLCDSL